ncbi:pyruvate kinase [Aureococcus anophagefferens]|uniref:Pyruvate kinase n=1 Tax=Aureococcus anophagefferens TaxID=44056 RepID=A0ABR1GD26_AURAN
MAATVDSAMVKQCGRLAESPFPPRSDAALHKRTRIICTLGPSSWDVDMLGVLLDEGMNVARLNFSHGDHETHKRTIGRLKEALAIRPGRHCAIMLDTKGPEIRTGFFAAPNDGGKLKFAKGDPLILTTDYDHKSDGTKLGCTYKKLPTSVKPGGQILVADGSLVLEVVSTDGTAEVTCKIMNDCAIGERKNMNLPGVLVDLPVLQDKDTKDLVEFACPMGVDFVAVSFVQSAADVRTVRKTLDGAGGTKIKIISKIENQEGLDNFASIVDETDSVMVARGDLGMEIPPERVFRAQKSMIATCNGAGKPVIVATQMLESMVSNPRPTRAECSDVANAVLDGADAVMLSGETAGGSFPKEAVAIMARTCVQAEGEFDFDAAYQKELATMRESGQDKGDSTSLQPSRDAAAKAIVVLAASGATTQLFAKYKCGIPLIVVTAHDSVARYAQALIPGAYVLHVPDLVKYGYADDTGDDEPKMVAEGTKFACSLGLVTSGDDFLCAVHSYRVNKQKNIAMRFFHASSVL